MTRRWLAALFAGGAAGQQIIPPGGTASRSITCDSGIRNCVDSSITTTWPQAVPRIPKPPNGTCPVCGTVAEKFAPKLSDYYADGVCLGPRLSEGTKIGGVTSVNAICRSADQDDLPKYRDIACANCSVIFRQKAEDVKP